MILEREAGGIEYADHETWNELANPEAHIEKRKALAKKLFSEENKEKLHQQASIDRKGRPVVYFRLVGADELKKILNGEVQSIDNPNVEKNYKEHEQWILSYLQRRLDPSTPDFAELQEDFTYENAMQFLYGKLPRKELAQLHKDGILGNITGILSTSIGAPMQDPTPKDVAIEMVIPDAEILVYPAGIDNLSYEREVGLTHIKKEWIADMYFGEDDFRERFLQNPRYPASAYFGKSETTDGRQRSRYSAVETLQDWTNTETMEDLLPASKLPELDVDNPVGDLPLAA